MVRSFEKIKMCFQYKGGRVKVKVLWQVRFGDHAYPGGAVIGKKGPFIGEGDIDPVALPVGNIDRRVSPEKGRVGKRSHRLQLGGEKPLVIGRIAPETCVEFFKALTDLLQGLPEEALTGGPALCFEGGKGIKEKKDPHDESDKQVA